MPASPPHPHYGLGFVGLVAAVVGVYGVVTWLVVWAGAPLAIGLLAAVTVAVGTTRLLVGPCYRYDNPRPEGSPVTTRAGYALLADYVSARAEGRRPAATRPDDSLPDPFDTLTDQDLYALAAGVYAGHGHATDCIGRTPGVECDCGRADLAAALTAAGWSV